MPSKFLRITLFIAPDGDFIRRDAGNMQHCTMVRAVLEPVAVPEPGRLPEVEIRNKVYARYTLKIPCSEREGWRVSTWPCGAWDNFLRGVIAALEAKGDAPWRDGEGVPR